MLDLKETGGELVPLRETMLTPVAGHDLSVCREPEQVLAEAQRAAKALQSVIENKARPVRFNGETYLEFEDWQTVGKFYGVTARVAHTAAVEFDGVRGFEARAVAVHAATGVEVSAADSMCLSDEPNWKNKPLFQLRSMAQTRACAKALRNVLAWVVVLAGYRPTPAEEMADVASARPGPAAPKHAPAAKPPGCSCAGNKHYPTNPRCAANGGEDQVHPGRQPAEQRRSANAAAAPLAHGSAEAQRVLSDDLAVSNTEAPEDYEPGANG